ncbi:MAG TPA: alkaline phosphatase family protein [Thermoplasmata archaeon]|nr:alkaline phosphatase family protein [Thermoplasmata archaeon]
MGSDAPTDRPRAGAPTWAVVVAGLAVCLIVTLSSLAVGPSGRYLENATTQASPTCQKNLQLATPICHVFVLYLENQEADKVYNASYEHYLATHYAYAARYYSVEHYSFPNYVAATAGYVDNWVHPMAWKNIVTLLDNRTPQLHWTAFMQSMLYPCWRNGTAAYRVDHNPFVWYDNLYDNLTSCRFHDQPFTTWSNDLATGNLPNYGFFSPNTTNDCWRFGLFGCDRWLRSWLSPLVNDSSFANSVWFITYDEGWSNDTASTNGTVGGGHVYTAAVSPYACAGKTSIHPYDAYDLFTTTEWLLDLPRLGSPNQDNWTADPPMKDLFCFPVGSTGGTVPGPSAPATLPVAAAAVRTEERPWADPGRATHSARSPEPPKPDSISCPRSRGPS